MSDSSPEPVTDAGDGLNTAKGAEPAPVATDLGGATVDKTEKPEKARRLHPIPVRIMHWLNAVAMIAMITSGWGIYNDYVIFNGVHFARWMRLGGWAAESLLWHFAGMWLLALNGLAYLVYGLMTGRFRRKLLPIRLSELVKTVIETLHFKIAHDDIRHYNAVQKLLYVIVILAGISQVVTGIAIWKPIQLSWLVALMGGFQSARIIHFLGMAVIVGFVIVHVALAVLVPRTLLAMLTGGPRLDPPAPKPAPPLPEALT